jgi:hypothetical protein
MLVVLSCAGFKRADYLLPAYPGAALLLGGVAERWYRSRVFQPRHLATALGLVAAVSALGWCYHLERDVANKEPAREYRHFAEEIRRLAPAPETVVFFRTESHALAFHVGRPLDILVQWPDLNARVAGSESTYVVMPVKVAEECPRHLRACRLEEVMRNTELAGGAHEKPLVLFRARPAP